MCLKLHTQEPRLILGYTSREHLLLDLDNTSITKAKFLVKAIQKQYPKVGHTLLVLSSIGNNTQDLLYTRTGRVLTIRKLNNYHAIFDNRIGYNLSCKIISILAGLNMLNRDYVKIREFRGDMTLRVSPTVCLGYVKPIPVPVAYVFNKHTNRHDGYIKKYMNVLEATRELFLFLTFVSNDLTNTPKTSDSSSNQSIIIT